MGFEAGPFNQGEHDEEDFAIIDQLIGDLAMGERVQIIAYGIPTAKDRSLIEDLREAGAEVIVPSDN